MNRPPYLALALVAVLSSQACALEAASSQTKSGDVTPDENENPIHPGAYVSTVVDYIEESSYLNHYIGLRFFPVKEVGTVASSLADCERSELELIIHHNSNVLLDDTVTAYVVTKGTNSRFESPICRTAATIKNGTISEDWQVLVAETPVETPEKWVAVLRNVKTALTEQLSLNFTENHSLFHIGVLVNELSKNALSDKNTIEEPVDTFFKVQTLLEYHHPFDGDGWHGWPNGGQIRIPNSVTGDRQGTIIDRLSGDND